jgi:hypothetical protein
LKIIEAKAGTGIMMHRITTLQLVPDHMSKRNVTIRKWNSIPLMHHVLETSP